MKYCSACGNPLKGTDRFCTECGSSIMPTSEAKVGQNEWEKEMYDVKVQRDVHTYPDGATYEGEWKDGKRHGQGIWIRPDGMRYEGSWKDDKPNGQGTLTSPKGEKRIGEWKDGKFVAESKPIAEQVFHRQEPENYNLYKQTQTYPEKQAYPENKNEKTAFIIGVIAICFAAVAAAWSFIGGACCGWGGWGFALIGFALSIVSLVFKGSSLGWWALILSIFAVIWVFLPLILMAMGITTSPIWLDGFN
jgi:hypothetical protein